MSKVKKYMDLILESVCGLLLVAMLAVVVWQVISRVVLQNPSTITEEFVRFSLVWLTMLASAYVVGKKSHLAVTLLSDTLTGSKKRILEIVIQMLFILFALIIMIYGGARATSLTMSQISPSLGLPMGIVYLSVPVSGVLILLYSILNLIELMKNKVTVIPDRENIESDIK